MIKNPLNIECRCSEVKFLDSLERLMVYRNSEYFCCLHKTFPRVFVEKKVHFHTSVVAEAHFMEFSMVDKILCNRKWCVVNCK